MRAFPRTPAVAVALLCAAPAFAADPLHQQIDKLVAAGHPTHAKDAAPRCDDAEFVRRVYLDLAGTIPTADEVRAFLTDKDAKKREKLIDKLLAAPGYARRMAQHLDVMLMERRADSKVPRAAWEQYLRESFAANKPYDALVREILSADGVDPKTRPAAKFYLDRAFEPNLVTKDIGRVFLGKNLQCAQCHDHPVIEDYKQEQYYGILAFLNRSFLFPNDKAPTAVIAEKADGDVNFMSVFDKTKTQKFTTPRLPGGKAIDEPKFEKGKEYKVAPAKDVKPVPAFSRREQLAKVVTGVENAAFARNAANRLWALMVGRGIVHPVDLDHTANPPSHPALLDLLAKDFAANKFDVKWLLREIALSDTYQRSSVVPEKLADPPEDRYLVGILKPLPPESMARAVLQATGQADAERVTLAKKFTEEALDARLAARAVAVQRAFAGAPGEPEEGFGVTLDQTLFLKFGAAVRDMTAAKPGTLTDRLAALKDDAAVADELFVSVLSRRPAADEAKAVAASLKGVADRKAALGELVWALVASGEFRFNH